MDVSFVDIFGNMFSGQILMRFCSFFLNSALLQMVDLSFIGFFNVRMNLFYNTICFLSREPARKICLGSEISERELSRYSISSLIVSFFTSILCFFIWNIFWFNSGLEIGNLAYSLVLGAYILSIFMEIAVEPIIIKQLKLGSTKQYVSNNSIMLITQKCMAFILLCCGIGPIMSFLLSQIAGSLLYLLLFINPLELIKVYRDAILDIYNQNGFDWNRFCLFGTFFYHSILKMFLTDGTNFLMTFANIIPLQFQGIYDAVDRLGSMAVRFILQPLEESSAIYFGINLKRGEGKVPPQVFDTFLLLFRLIATIGIFLLAYGLTYSKLVAFLYGGDILLKNHADQLLFWYSLYLPVIAVNGLTECFVMAMFDSKQLASHAKFFSFAVLINTTLNYCFCRYFDAKGFIMANIVSYLIRIWFNWRYIGRNAFHNYPNSIWSKIVPNIPFLLIIFATSIVLTISSIKFNETTNISAQLMHVSIGIAMTAVNAGAFYQNEYPRYSGLKLKKN